MRKKTGYSMLDRQTPHSYWLPFSCCLGANFVHLVVYSLYDSELFDTLYRV